MPDVRVALEQTMRATLADQAANRCWYYRAVRPCPMPTSFRKFVAKIRKVGDCSKGVQFLFWWTPPATDPMQMNWGPDGNSQTLWMRCQHLGHPSELKVGDIVTSGRSGSEHAAAVLEAGTDPTMWSWGHQGAPNSYPLSADRREHQYLRAKLPDYKPTAEDKLRARTDWFAWMAWYGTADSPNGEGDWQHHKRQDPKVRPNVPKRIPASWWARRVAFLARRNRGNKATTKAA